MPQRKITTYFKKTTTNPRKRTTKTRMLGLARSRYGRKAYKQRIHYFVRGSSATPKFDDILGGAATRSGQYFFTLNDVINPTDFTNMFDEYRITHIQLKFYLKVDPGNSVANSQGFYPRIWYVIDHTQDAAYTTVEQFREDSRCVNKLLTPYRPVVINIKPSTLEASWNGGSGVPPPVQVSTPRWKKWFRTLDPSISYGALKWLINDMTPTFQNVQIEAKYWIQTKESK